MISYCIRVLKGDEPEDNPRKITKPVAVILLAHYVGDIHQPLHVGAEYFDAAGQPSDPDRGGQALSDIGGNSLSLVFQPPTTALAPVDDAHPLPLHVFWDEQVVDIAVRLLKCDPAWQIPQAAGDPEIAAILARREPAGWKVNEPDVAKWSLAWANDILPIAKNVHTLLRFEGIQQVHGAQVQGKAIADGNTYPNCAGEVVKSELHKAGWRLADLLTKVL
jgi:hypothetical protein